MRTCGILMEIDTFVQYYEKGKRRDRYFLLQIENAMASK
jgi:hypothetical protein